MGACWTSHRKIMKAQVLFSPIVTSRCLILILIQVAHTSEIFASTMTSSPDNTYDYVVCTEVLEHTLRLFDAMDEIYRILKPGGLLFLSVPFNFRIHGPLPDCWRFAEHGLRVLADKFIILELNAMETPDRPLMPIHYTMVAQKPEHAGTRGDMK